MKIKALVWMGIKTDTFQEMEHFMQDVMGLPQVHHAQDFAVFQLPNKDKVEIFGPQGPNQHFAPDSIVCGFLVEDIHQAGRNLFAPVSNWLGHCTRVRLMAMPGSTFAALMANSTN
jgi:hypothetical protein